ncbi:hypothetical protein [Pseudomonas sp. LH1G9]|uniref:hypothetical protein n=1 Tax=Pseudomonas sp. LH1G9 TaxID=2083055 RepID=UPI000CF30511|nr:hypothetical protein [Pseudomonas sp. LH1G9]
MFDTAEVTSKEIEQLRIGKLPVTTANLIYKAAIQLPEELGEYFLNDSFNCLFTKDAKGNPCPSAVYRYELVSRNMQHPRYFEISIYNQAGNVGLHNVLINKSGLDILAGV